MSTFLTPKAINSYTSLCQRALNATVDVIRWCSSVRNVQRYEKESERKAKKRQADRERMLQKGLARMESVLRDELNFCEWKLTRRDLGEEWIVSESQCDRRFELRDLHDRLSLQPVEWLGHVEGNAHHAVMLGLALLFHNWADMWEMFPKLEGHPSSVAGVARVMGTSTDIWPDDTTEIERLADRLRAMITIEAARAVHELEKASSAMSVGITADDLMFLAELANGEQPERDTQETPTQKSREPMTPNAAKVYEMLLELPEHKAMTTRDLLDGLAGQNIFIDEGTFYSRVTKELEPYGLKNRPKVGYYIPLSLRPQKQ